MHSTALQRGLNWDSEVDSADYLLTDVLEASVFSVAFVGFS